MKQFTFLIVLFMLVSCATRTEKVIKKQVDDAAFRPDFHFVPTAGWMNDPNGMVFYEGEYHLFYQHYPDSNAWGPMHWGHAVSSDMVSWGHLPIALYPDSLGYTFSGSVVVDWNNSSGLGIGDIPPLVAIFTHHNPVLADLDSVNFQYQSLAYSNDRGRSWEKYDGNPVLGNPGIRDYRDPKVFWYEPDSKWVMILAVKDRIYLYSSPDLKSWAFLSEFGEKDGAHGGLWECPDLFKLTDPEGEEKWILLVSVNPGGPQGGSATQYFIGLFDGTVFVKDDDYTRWIDVGADNYAGVTWSDIPIDDGRRIFLGWMSNWQYAQVVPTYTWRGAMTIPSELTLTYVKGSLELKSTPIAELDDYFELVPEDKGQLPESGSRVTISDIREENTLITFSNSIGEHVTIMISPNRIAVDRSNSGIVDFEKGFRKIQSFKHYLTSIDKIEVFLDHSSIEIFVNDGELVMTELIFPTEQFTSYEVSEGASVALSEYKPEKE